MLLALAASQAAADPIPTTGDLPTDVTPEQTKYPEVVEAQRRVSERDFDGALESLQAAHEKYEELPPGEVLMSQLLFSLIGRAQNQRQQVGLMQAARNYLEQAVVKHPRDPDAFALLGELAVRDRRITEAGLLYTNAMAFTEAMQEAHPRKQGLVQRSHAGLATVAEARDDWATAEKHLRAWIASDENNAQARFRLGRALFNTKDAQKRKLAYAEFQTAKSLDDRMPPAELTIGQLFNQSGNQDVAAQWMDYAVKTSADKPVPYQVATRLGVSNWHWSRDEIEKAKEHAAAALQIDPNSIGAKMMLGLIARYEKDLATAERLFNEVHRDAPENLTASNQLAICLADQGDEAKLQRALGLANSNLHTQQNNLLANATLGWVYYRMGRLEEAEQLLESVAAAGRPSPELIYYLASVMAKRDRADDARKLLQNVIDDAGPQIYRAEAKALFDELAGGGTSSSP